ncbi:nascent polypeptide-associated complex subunit alpha, muscle-specific form-like [Hippopotamus amphibius kiboko]|uniref:nascent polypeptide-associated complex subunit alpha, muscle-specific form-like n=1 Tax=Hippopotamus amphibius kiboko TaxID=575201 RepID=UPI002591A858|nr:nascent polypeptide-associated complex subunit alpha, muscle-specific form-like [Hippopotamus amphibius kiboko]
MAATLSLGVELLSALGSLGQSEEKVAKETACGCWDQVARGTAAPPVLRVACSWVVCHAVREPKQPGGSPWWGTGASRQQPWAAPPGKPFRCPAPGPQMGPQPPGAGRAGGGLSWTAWLLTSPHPRPASSSPTGPRRERRSDGPRQGRGRVSPVAAAGAGRAAGTKPQVSGPSPRKCGFCRRERAAQEEWSLRGVKRGWEHCTAPPPRDRGSSSTRNPDPPSAPIPPRPLYSQPLRRPRCALLRAGTDHHVSCPGRATCLPAGCPGSVQMWKLQLKRDATVPASRGGAEAQAWHGRTPGPRSPRGAASVDQGTPEPPQVRGWPASVGARGGWAEAPPTRAPPPLRQAPHLRGGGHGTRAASPPAQPHPQEPLSLFSARPGSWPPHFASRGFLAAPREACEQAGGSTEGGPRGRRNPGDRATLVPWAPHGPFLARSTSPLT